MKTLSSFLALSCLALGSSVRGQVFDPTAEFSITRGNPNGVWSYGWMPVGFGSLTLLTSTRTGYAGSPQWAGWNSDGTPGMWKNLGSPAYGVPTGWLSLHPGPGTQPCVLRWTAPSVGGVSVQGQFLAGDGGVMQVAVRLNGQAWWAATDRGTFDLRTNVVAGATLDFTVSGGYGYGNTPLQALITLTPFALRLTRTAPNSTVSFTAPRDGTYVLQFTPTLPPSPAWGNVLTRTLSANEFFTLTESRGKTAGFYRVRLE